MHVLSDFTLLSENHYLMTTLIPGFVDAMAQVRQLQGLVLIVSFVLKRRLNLGWEYSSVVERLSSMHNALGHQHKREGEKEGQEEGQGEGQGQGEGGD
jgi:hypothetical protein